MQFGSGVHFEMSRSSTQQPNKQPTKHFFMHMQPPIMPPSPGPPVVQEPLTHESPWLHGLLQPPQLLTSVLVSTHCWLQHVPMQPWHAATVMHAPLMHVSVAPHARPHTPQLLLSLIVFLQPLAPQQVCAAPQMEVIPFGPHWQVPPMHAVPEAHTLPQLPQLFLSALTSMHLLLQHVAGEWHCAQEPTPAMSTSPFGLPRVTPQPVAAAAAMNANNRRGLADMCLSLQKRAPETASLAGTLLAPT
jgi:hypothetical protein